jgi:hypothetical protein
MKKSKATEALRVATDIAAIKAALHKRGYRLRKQPKQPVWKVITPLSPPTTKASVDAPRLTYNGCIPGASFAPSPICVPSSSDAFAAE